MSSFWRQAGLNYIRYSSICARVTRESLKPNLQVDAAKRGDETIIKAIKWEGGKPVGKGTGAAQVAS